MWALVLTHVTVMWPEAKLILAVLKDGLPVSHLSRHLLQILSARNSVWYSSIQSWQNACAAWALHDTLFILHACEHACEHVCAWIVWHWSTCQTMLDRIPHGRQWIGFYLACYSVWAFDVRCECVTNIHTYIHTHVHMFLHIYIHAYIHNIICIYLFVCTLIRMLEHHSKRFDWYTYMHDPKAVPKREFGEPRAHPYYNFYVTLSIVVYSFARNYWGIATLQVRSYTVTCYHVSFTS